MGDWPNNTFAKIDKKHLQVIGRKGGKGNINSPKQRVAGFIRKAKLLGISPKMAEKTLMLIQDSEFSGVDWHKHIDFLEECAKQEPKLHFPIANLKRDWHKAMHGEKHVNQNLNINVNVLSDEEIDKTLKRLLNENNPRAISDSNRKREEQS